MRPDTPMEPDPSAPPQITDADYNAAMNDTEPRDFNERPLSQQSLRPEAKFDYSRTAEVDDTIEMLRKKKMRGLKGEKLVFAQEAAEMQYILDKKREARQQRNADTSSLNLSRAARKAMQKRIEDRRKLCLF